jgi:hypothetical protein
VLLIDIRRAVQNACQISYSPLSAQKTNNVNQLIASMHPLTTPLFYARTYIVVSTEQSNG